MSLTVYQSGEIHSDWREEIQQACQKEGLDVQFTSPATNHEASDGAGDHLGQEANPFWRDHKSAKINAIRTRTLIKNSDMMIVRIGGQYKQWNAAFDAGYCAALDKPYITLHDSDIIPVKRSRRNRRGLGIHHWPGC